MRIIVSLITLWIFIFSMGCQTNPVGTDTPLENIASPVSPPNQGDVTQMPTSIPRPSYTGLQALIEKAKAEAQEEARRIIAEAQAEDKANEILADVERQDQELEAKANANIEKAVNYVLERVIGRA